MITLRPFRALHYDQAKVDPAAVVAPPYDVIDAAAHARLWARDPHNVVRLILNREPDRYAASAAALEAWRQSGVLVRDDAACFYDYVQDYTLPDGRQFQRTGLMAAVRLEPFAAGNIRPHERTFARAKEDRLRLLEACRTNLSPIFGIYPGSLGGLDAVRDARRARPWIDLTDDQGERHRVWRVDNPDTVAAITRAARELTVFIADGHHRYETALAYRERQRAAGGADPESPYNFILMYLAAMDDPGLVILPTHRLLRHLPAGVAETWLASLERYFTIESFPAGDEGQQAFLRAVHEDRAGGVIGLALSAPNRLAVLRRREGQALNEVLGGIHPTVRRLDVTVLDAVVLRHTLGIDPTRAAQEGELEYTHDDLQAIGAVRSGRSAVGFLLPAPRIEDVQAVCVAGETVPEKSTYFYPKLMSGLVFNVLDEGARPSPTTAPPLTTTA